MDIGEQEARRADNQIWNAAGAYGFATGSRGYEPNGEASLYFNTAIGLVRQLYDYKKLELLFTALKRHSGGELQSELLWLGLERCAYLRCRDARPALTFLRQSWRLRAATVLRLRANSGVLPTARRTATLRLRIYPPPLRRVSTG